MNHLLLTMKQKKYILKPGRHQFVPGDHARHDNENLTDTEAKWYLDRYPHIKALFSTLPEGKRIKRKRIGVIAPKSVKSPNK